MKTEAERNERDQRRAEFTITLLGCTVIKAKAPRRAGRLRACPVSSAAALISSRVAHRNVPTNLQEDTPSSTAVPPPPPLLHSPLPHRRICRASTTGCHGTSSSLSIWRKELRLLPHIHPEKVSFFFSFSFFFFDVLIRTTAAHFF